ncbi:MAG: SDR family oxidoreductase [Micromonosporaceae bacterium]
MTGQTLITGAAGYLGRRIAARLLAETDDRLLLAVRATRRTELAAVAVTLRRELGPGTGRRIAVVPVELCRPNPFQAVDPAGVTRVVHAAARTEFTVRRDVARQVNVDGTRLVAEFAARCPKLERLVVLSTLFSAGRRTGLVAEVAHDGDAGFANHYEWSKYEAERLLPGHPELPLAIARLATVVADDRTGVVSQYNAFHNTVKLFFYGLLSLMPGDPATPLYLATADFTSRGVAQLARPELPGGIYHLAPAPSQTITLGELIGVVFDAFGADPGFRRRRLLRPEFCDLASFRDLVAASRSLSASPMAQALGSVAPFAEQMFLPKDFDNRRLAEVWTSDPQPDPRDLAAAVCGHLVRTRWDRTPSRPIEETA